jgi:uncharacterized alpha-E superfamily protein
MMLSRVAERMYWFGRYIERAENTARLLNVNTNLMLDLPKVKFIWNSLIDITGSQQVFAARFQVEDERNVVKFLLDDPSGSIKHSIEMARENVRTTREIMPNETWEKVNELYMYVPENIASGLRRTGRHQFLKDVMRSCQEITGYLAGSMSANEAYNFIKIGRNLERADMTTRIIDVGVLNLTIDENSEIKEYENILWNNVLRSSTAYQMYRQHVKDRVNGEDVCDFMINDPAFPRSVTHCLKEVQSCFETLPNPDHPLRTLAHTQRMIAGSDVISLLNEGGLHQYIDEIQEDLADIHEQLVQNWFRHDSAVLPAAADAG